MPSLNISPGKATFEVVDKNLGPSAKKIAKQIDDDRESLMFDFGGDKAREVVDHLLELGWAPYRSMSFCKKATYEANLRKGKTRLDVIVSNFLGVFTEFDVMAGVID